MSKNYEALHYIRDRLMNYDPKLSNAIQRLFNIEDQSMQAGGCVIDSIVIALLFKKFGIDSDIHLGEICADGHHDALHCWLTLDDQIFDFGIYGNSKYNPCYRGPQFNHPLIFEDNTGVKYADGTTERSWLTNLSGMPIIKYINGCPQNRVRKLFLKSLELRDVKENMNMIDALAKDMYFPIVKRLDFSPSGHAPMGEF